MKPNDTRVTSADLSLAHDALADAHMADAALRKEYDTPPTYRAPGSAARVAGLHRASKFNLKVAEVTALIAIAEALAKANQPTPGPTMVKDGRALTYQVHEL